MPRFAPISSLPMLILVVGVGASATAPRWAHAQTVTSPSPPPVPIWGGTPTAACGWPTTVYLGGCSGTLVHPELVIFASHCLFFAGGTPPSFATFGESIDPPARQVPIESCTMYPDWQPNEVGFGHDVAFCRLAEPVFDVPIVPIAMGCEADGLVAGQAVTLVGFGMTDTGSNGIKHEVVTTINGMRGRELSIGGNGNGASCNGDSGGPAYVQLDDGTWRVFGVTSRGVSASCADESIYGLIHSHVEWIETSAGLDITPCHDADGTWNPTDGCGSFPTDPGPGGGTWRRGCPQPLGPALSETCGPGFGEGGTTGTTGGEDTGPLDDTAATTLPGGTAADTAFTTTTDASTGTTTASIDDAPPKDGCSCTTPRGTPPPWPWLMLLTLPFARRRS